MDIGLYVHIPFCAARCPYCDFTITAVRARPEQAYGEALLSELGARFAQAPWRDAIVRSVFFGGGTPSLVDASLVAAVLAQARALAGPRFLPREVTLEANPEGLAPEKLCAWREAGVDRISLGAQSFHDRHLAFLGRAHRAADIRAAVRAAREAGFANVSLDLIFGMPGQTLEELEEDLDQALALRPEHLSCYNLTAEPATRFGRELRAGKWTLPGEEVQARMFTRTGERLEAAGLRRYEISNFARPGFESIHNRHYWRRESTLGIGTGAHSFAADSRGGTRWWNVRDHRRYIAAAREGKSCVEGSERLGPEDARREWVFLRLREVEGLGPREFLETFGRELDEAFPGVLQVLIEEGLIDASDDRLALTDRGRLLSDEVFLRFF